jgi:hypothetical protein
LSGNPARAPGFSQRQQFLGGTHHSTTALLTDSVGGLGVVANLVISALEAGPHRQPPQRSGD